MSDESVLLCRQSRLCVYCPKSAISKTARTRYDQRYVYGICACMYMVYVLAFIIILELIIVFQEFIITVHKLLMKDMEEFLKGRNLYFVFLIQFLFFD